MAVHDAPDDHVWPALPPLPTSTTCNSVHSNWIGDSATRGEVTATEASAVTLDLLLRSHGINTLLITGVNTNSCVLSTVAAANARDYAVVVVRDVVDTMDDPSLHDAALLCIRTAFGHVLTRAEVAATDDFAAA